MPVIRVELTEEEYFELLKAKRKGGFKTWRDFFLALYRSSIKESKTERTTSLPSYHSTVGREVELTSQPAEKPRVGTQVLEPLSGRQASPDLIFIDVVRLLKAAGWDARPGARVRIETLNKAILKVRHSNNPRTAEKYRKIFLRMGWLAGVSPNVYELTEEGYRIAEEYLDRTDRILNDGIPIPDLEKRLTKVWRILKEEYGYPTPRKIPRDVFREVCERVGINPIQLDLMEKAQLIKYTPDGVELRL